MPAQSRSANGAAGLDALPEVAEHGRVEGIAVRSMPATSTAPTNCSPPRDTAVRRLGGEFQGASAIVQAADEAEAIVRRVPNPLEEILDEATRTDPSDWTKRFDSAYKGRTVLIVDDLKAVPDSQGNGRYELEYQIFPVGEGIPKSRGHIDLSGFKLLESLKPLRGRSAALRGHDRLDADGRRQRRMARRPRTRQRGHHDPRESVGSPRPLRTRRYRRGGPTMNRVRRVGIALCLCLSLASPNSAQAQAVKPVVVEPDELSKRTDLLGKVILVDDRGGFQYHNETRMFDEINLRRRLRLSLSWRVRYGRGNRRAPPRFDFKAYCTETATNSGLTSPSLKRCRLTSNV